MKLKYYLRGLGAGILFTSVIVIVALMTVGKISDDEIIKRAERLGMAFEEENPVSTGQAVDAAEKATGSAVENSTDSAVENDKNATDSAIENDKNATDSAIENKNTTQQAVENKNTTGQAAEKNKTDQTKNKTASKENASSGSKKQNTVKVTITVEAGMTSGTLAEKLKRANLVDDATAFNSYLMRNGYSTKLEVGRYVIQSGLTYRQLAQRFVGD